MPTTPTFKIHPAIGIARLGDSKEFCLTAEKPRGLPIECDSQGITSTHPGGHEKPIEKFKDSHGRIKRQAARFRVYTYDDAKDQRGRELKIGDTFQFYTAKYGILKVRVTDIQWTVYLANKKASWYEFKELQGEHGYAPDHPLRNPSVTDPGTRQRLIIDPGPQTVSYLQASARHAEFAREKNPAYPQSFPPPLAPNSIDTLGEIIATQQDGHNRLLVLGGHGNSGSFKSDFGDPNIGDFANNDGWFDDVADGPVTANLLLQPLDSKGQADPNIPQQTMPVGDPAWVLTASPGYVPEIENIVTLDDVLYDMALRYFGYNPEIYQPADTSGLSSAKAARTAAAAQRNGWNKGYYPYFYRDILPILRRPYAFNWLAPLEHYGDPHNSVPGSRNNFDLNMISVPPHKGDTQFEKDCAAKREFIYNVLREEGQENLYSAPVKNDDNYLPELMPKLFGDNPLSNTLPSKFLRLTDTQLFLLRQWRDGKFINEKAEGLEPQIDNPPPSGSDLDCGVLWNTLGGSFCPGGEVCWIIRNPAIYAKPFRIKQAPYTPGALSQPAVVIATADTPGNFTSSDLSQGLEPGDLTKYGPLPWQADFNECSSDSIDIAYDGWINTYPKSTGDPAEPKSSDTVFWWPAHRPLEVSLPTLDKDGKIAEGSRMLWTRSLPQNNAGDFEMVTAWVTLGFIRNFGSEDNPLFLETERNDGSDKLPVVPHKEHKK